jgi:hypothetical protein
MLAHSIRGGERLQVELKPTPTLTGIAKVGSTVEWNIDVNVHLSPAFLRRIA